MKRNLVVTLVVAFVLLGAVLSVNAEPRMRVTVPFEFRAGNKVMPAGEYFVEFRYIGAASTGSTLFIINRDRQVVQILPAIVGSRDAGEQDYLVFNRYGNAYFLSKACLRSYASTPRRTRAEKEMALAYSRPEPTGAVVIASND